MCFGVPARILSITAGAVPMAVAEMAGEERQCCLAYVPEAQVGDYVLIQNGFATTLLDEASAQETLAVLAEFNLASAAELPPLADSAQRD